MVCLDGAVLPNSINFANVREALTDETIRLGQGDPLELTELQAFLEQEATLNASYPLAKLFK